MQCEHGGGREREREREGKSDRVEAEAAARNTYRQCVRSLRRWWSGGGAIGQGGVGGKVTFGSDRIV